jgi:hypothetical protein
MKVAEKEIQLVKICWLTTDSVSKASRLTSSQRESGQRSGIDNENDDDLSRPSTDTDLLKPANR